MAAEERTATPAGIAAWVLQILLGLAIAGAGAAKLAGDFGMVRMFDDIGTGQWLRFVVGALEVAAAVGLMVPRLRALAAFCLLLLLIGATLVNLTVLDSNPLSAIALAALASGILLLRRQELPFRPKR
ncbi:DoxX family protein [Actinomadura miaoliensis]|uniref:DoxX family protein n=1 Tax=Actinomadura miaoliensis TaxID=430685 RepID=A0ABP7VS77_9ACTN